MRRARDDKLVGILLKVLLEEGTVSSQSRLAELVNDRLPRRLARATPVRLRVLAVRSGLVQVTIQTRTGGRTPMIDRCPVCRSALRRRTNQTLTGKRHQTGYRCTTCSWWTGDRYRLPQRYVFHARMKRRGSDVAFVVPTPPAASPPRSRPERPP